MINFILKATVPCSGMVTACAPLIQITLMVVILRFSKGLKGMLASPREGEDVTPIVQ